MEYIDAENRDNDVPRDDIRMGCQCMTQDEKKEEDVGD